MVERTRRKFLVRTGQLVGAAALTGCQDPSPGEAGEVGADELGADAAEGQGSTDVSEEGSDTTDASATDASATDASATDASEGGESCAPTVEQIAGPFPQAGFERSELDLYGHEGVPFSLSGRVVDVQCQPLADAVVLLWHATPSPPGVHPRSKQPDPEYAAAVYDHAAEAGQKTPDGQTIPTDAQMYYGWVRTDAQGNYAFSSLRPGWYLNGASYRTSHLHARVFVNDELRVTTQLYFSDDEFNATDGIYAACAEEGDCLLLMDDEGAASFDLVVA